MQHQAPPSSASLSDDGNVSIDQTKLLQRVILVEIIGSVLSSNQKLLWKVYGKWFVCCGVCAYVKGLQVICLMTVSADEIVMEIAIVGATQ